MANDKIQTCNITIFSVPVDLEGTETAAVRRTHAARAALITHMTHVHRVQMRCFDFKTAQIVTTAVSRDRVTNRLAGRSVSRSSDSLGRYSETRQMTAKCAKQQYTSDRKHNATKEHLFLCASVDNYREDTENKAAGNDRLLHADQRSVM